MRIKTITAVALGLVLTPTHAEMVAQHIDPISKRTGIVYQLSDTQCKDGSYRVLISTTDTYSFPAASMYGDGCWSVSKGKIHIIAKSFTDGTAINISYDATLFKAGNEKVDWSKFTRDPESEGPSGKAKALIDRANQLNDRCRGGSGDDPKTMQACEQREAAMAQVSKAGWCWGPSDAPGYQQRWIRCR